MKCESLLCNCLATDNIFFLIIFHMEIIILQETGDVISKTITCLHAYFIVMKELWQAKNNVTSHRGSAYINTN